MKTPLPKFPHHRGVPKHHFGDKTPLLATLGVDNLLNVDTDSTTINSNFWREKGKLSDFVV